jgi:hypothetical protein
VGVEFGVFEGGVGARGAAQLFVLHLQLDLMHLQFVQEAHHVDFIRAGGAGRFCSRASARRRSRRFFLLVGCQWPRDASLAQLGFELLDRGDVDEGDHHAVDHVVLGPVGHDAHPVPAAIPVRPAFR